MNSEIGRIVLRPHVAFIENFSNDEGKRGFFYVKIKTLVDFFLVL